MRGRAAALAGAGYCFASYRVNLSYVVAIDGNAGQSVGCGAVGHLRIAGGIDKGDFRGVEVVFADEEHWQLPVGRQVDAFVESSVGYRPVAKKRHADLGDAQELKGVASTGSLEDAGADDAAGAHHPHLRREKVHGATAPLRAARSFAKKLGD